MNETRNRVILSSFIVVSFLVSVHAISLAMHNHAEVSSEWKEILLLMLGALISNFSKVVDYWFSKPPSSPCSPPTTPPTNNEQSTTK